MKKVYTKTGDRGTTALHGGQRVAKDDIRIEANGTLDELNAIVGIVRTLLPPDHDYQRLLHGVQRELMTIMSHVATPPSQANPNPLDADELTQHMEDEIDRLSTQVPDPPCFLLPGGTPASAQLHHARTVARRAERRLWALHRQCPLDQAILRWINRLSDLFYVMARAEAYQQGCPEERWKAFDYKRRREEGQP